MLRVRPQHQPFFGRSVRVYSESPGTRALAALTAGSCRGAGRRSTRMSPKCPIDGADETKTLKVSVIKILLLRNKGQGSEERRHRTERETQLVTLTLPKPMNVIAYTWTTGEA